MKFLLDTNVCIALINGTSDGARRRFANAVRARSDLFVSSITIFELLYGVFKSARVRFNADRLEVFMAGTITVLPFDEDDARAAGSINADLKRGGNMIGGYDILLAGQASQKNLTLATANASEFSRVNGLAWENWAKG